MTPPTRLRADRKATLLAVSGIFIGLLGTGYGVYRLVLTLENREPPISLAPLDLLVLLAGAVILVWGIRRAKRRPEPPPPNRVGHGWDGQARILHPPGDDHDTKKS